MGEVGPDGSSPVGTVTLSHETLAALLNLARAAGIDPAHPAMVLAAAALASGGDDES
jgi:hypothetical protein